MAFVKEVEQATGKPASAASNEVNRQIHQVIVENDLTKSGGDD